jgi:TonB dependent receptor
LSNAFQANQAWASLDSGDYEFAGVFTQNPSDLANPDLSAPVGVGYADFLLGMPNAWGLSMQPETGLRAWNLAAFAQDDYKMASHLTINMGLRFTRQSGWSEVENRMGSYTPTLPNPGIDPATGLAYGNGAMCFAGRVLEGYHCPTTIQKATKLFQPRLGFAWAPKDAWSIRGGFGVFSMMQGANNYTTGAAYGWSTQGSLSSTDVLTPVFLLSDGPPPGSIFYPTGATRTPDSLNGQSISYVPYNTQPPYTLQWNLDIQHQLSGRIGLDAAYVGSRGVHLLFPRDMDQAEPAPVAVRPVPQFNGILENFYDGVSNYHSLQLSARTIGAHGLSFRVNYTLSKAQDLNTATGWSGNVQNESYQSAFRPRANYGLAAFDITHLFNGHIEYELPLGRGKAFLNSSSVLNGLVGGWRLSSTFQVHTGVPFSVFMATNTSNSLAGSLYPNRVGKGTLLHPTINNWFDSTSSSFQAPPAYSFGNAGRHILRGPAWRNVNLSLAKQYGIKKLGDKRNLEVRVDSYDVFNHPNFGLPDAYIGDATVGQITTSSTSRNLQIGAKLSF